MKKIILISVIVLNSLNAAEQCPVNKISLARGLECDVYRTPVTDLDSKIDAICLKLGRVSAILRRTQGQLPDHPSAPVPPAEWKTRAEEIEGFCGIGNNTSLPRGLMHPEYLRNGFKEAVKARIKSETDWIEANKDKDPIENECAKPAELSHEEANDCLIQRILF